MPILFSVKRPWTRQPYSATAINRQTALGRAVVDVFSPHGLSGMSLPHSQGILTSSGQTVKAGELGKVWNFAAAPTDGVWTRDPINPTGGSILLICKPDWAQSDGNNRTYVNLSGSGLNLRLGYIGTTGKKWFQFSSRGNFGATIIAEGISLADDAELQVRHIIVASWRNESSGGANDGTAVVYQDNVPGTVAAGIDLRLFGGATTLTMLSSVTGDVELIVFFDRPFNSAEAKALHVNSYRIFRPRTTSILIPAVAGPTIADSDVMARWRRRGRR